MDAEEIERVLRKTCGSKFIGVFAKDRLPETIVKPALIIANTDPHNEPGTHWVALWFDDDDCGEYFDSFGREPEEHFEMYMNKHCSRWTYNPKQLQSVVSRFCGHYCIFYGSYRSIGFDVRSIVSMFTRDYGLNDVMAHSFVCRRLK